MRTNSDKRQIEYVQVSTLTPYARNSRTHTPQQVKQIAASIREFGFTNPVLIDETNGIIAGHGRVMAAEHLQLDVVPCIRLDYLTQAQKRAYVIADNKLALNAGWDDELLKVELDDLHSRDYDLSLLGFDAGELESIMQIKLDDDVQQDEVPEPPAEPITKRGDIWQLGAHRMMCGDSTSAADVSTLMAGHKADMCFTSPPYALGKSKKLSRNATLSAKGNAYDVHDDNAENWAKLMRLWYEVSREHVQHVWLVNVQMLSGNKRELVRWMADNSEYLVDLITWDKGNAAPQMKQGVLTSRAEWIICLGKHNASRVIPLSTWHGNHTTVYAAPPQHNNDYASKHGATMPLHLPLYAIGELCDQSQSIYEPFAGTGTTLIAAEQLNRICYGMEISPAYCDVIVQRWEALTGKKAELING